MPTARSAIHGKPEKFTLVELLVVIVIISLLASLLLPALRNAVATARGIRCCAQLKNIGIALTGYADDFGNYIPPDSYTYGSPWSTLLEKYLGEPPKIAWNARVPASIFRCPATRMYPGNTQVFHSYTTTVTNTPNTYAFCKEWASTGDYHREPPRRSQWHNPSNLVLLADGLMNFDNRANAMGLSNFHQNNCYKIDPRHNGSAVLLFADNHVRSVPLKKLGFDRTWQWDPDKTNPFTLFIDLIYFPY